TGARGRRLAANSLRPLGDMVLDVLHLLCPTPVIHAERLEAAVAGNLVEAGLGEQKQCAGRGLLQPEFDERGHLLRVIYFGIDSIRMPSEGKKSFGLHFLHNGLPFEVFVAGIRNLAARDLTRHKRAIQLHPKQFPKLTVVRYASPDPRNWRLEFNAFLNAVIHLRNLQVAYYPGHTEKATLWLHVMPGPCPSRLVYRLAFFFARVIPARNPCSTMRLYPDLSMLARVAAEMPPGVAASCSSAFTEILDSRQVKIPSASAWAAAVKAVLRSRPSFSAAPASASSAW